MNVFEVCQVVPPLMLYSSGAVPPVAVTTIEPLFVLQEVGAVGCTFVIVACAGAVTTTGLDEIWQELSEFLTKTVYVPAGKFKNWFEACHVVPLSIEYWSGAMPPVADTVAEPFVRPQSVTGCGVICVKTGVGAGFSTVGFEAVTRQVPPTYRTRIRYEPGARLLNVLLVYQVVPLMLYSSAPVPLAETMMLPIGVAQVGWAILIFETIMVVGPETTTCCGY